MEPIDEVIYSGAIRPGQKRRAIYPMVQRVGLNRILDANFRQFVFDPMVAHQRTQALANQIRSFVRPRPKIHRVYTNEERTRAWRYYRYSRFTYRKVASWIGCSHSTIGRWIKKSTLPVPFQNPPGNRPRNQSNRYYP